MTKEEQTLLTIVENQRNAALSQIASLAAALTGAQERIAELEGALAEAGPKDAEAIVRPHKR